MVGMRAAKAKTSVAIAAILSPRLLSWKRIPKLRTSKKKRGIKMVIRAERGNL